jgi:NhaP-type Na+/H+ or K+/H+ antiporter
MNEPLLRVIIALVVGVVVGVVVGWVFSRWQARTHGS